MNSQLLSANRDVFINCPFDSKYVPILQAIIFAVHDAGFVARSALEDQNTGSLRLTKIMKLIRQCLYGIHDLSRVDTTRGKLPRFNMPFELGLFMGCQEFGGPDHENKQTLILDSKAYRFQKTLSDTAGLDAKAHHNRPEQVIRLVRNWLRSASGDTKTPGGDEIIKRYRRFKRALPAILKTHKIRVSEIKTLEFYSDYCNFVSAWLQKNQG